VHSIVYYSAVHNTEQHNSHILYFRQSSLLRWCLFEGVGGDSTKSYSIYIVDYADSANFLYVTTQHHVTVLLISTRVLNTSLTYSHVTRLTIAVLN